MAKITQSQAREFRRRANAAETRLRQQTQSWTKEWMSEWVQLDMIKGDMVLTARIHTARRLGHAVVVVTDGEYLEYYAAPIVGKDAQ